MGFFDKNCVAHISQNVPEMNLETVMPKCCIRKSKVSSQICITRLMSDEGFNHIVDKNSSSPKSILCSFRPYKLS